MASRPKSILWVDDEIESLESHRRFLTDQGYEVSAATHGDDALELLRRRSYGLVLVDEQMPGRRGLELFQAIRELDPAVPVVMVTKSEDPAVLREAIGMGSMAVSLFSVHCEIVSVVLPPRNNITTQSPRGEGGGMQVSIENKRRRVNLFSF